MLVAGFLHDIYGGFGIALTFLLLLIAFVIWVRISEK